MLKKTAPIVTILAALLLSTGCASSNTQASNTAAAQQANVFVPLYEAIGRRLALATDVAAAKFATQAPVENLAQEANVVNAAKAKAEPLGIDGAEVVLVMRNQIDASKILQNANIALWTSDPGSARTSYPPLTSTRDRLTVETDAIIGALAATTAERHAATCSARAAEARNAVFNGSNATLRNIAEKAIDAATASICVNRS